VKSEDQTTDRFRKQLIDQFKNRLGFADELRYEFDHIWKRIDEHPFLVEMSNGKLPIEKYRIYAVQNYFYFGEWSRVFAGAASRAPTATETLRILKWLTNTGLEFDSYMAILRSVGVTDDQLLEVTTNSNTVLPAFRAYTDYMYKICSTRSVGEFAACVLPCEWTYSSKDIGGLGCALRIARGLADHYGVDMETASSYGNYSNNRAHLELIVSLKDAISEEVNKEGHETREKIRDIFQSASQFEYLIWDSVYRL
jgi:thiaminase/transcriptional activator TenA